MVSRLERIEQILRNTFAIEHIELYNESHMHSVPKNSETHFKLILVSPQFDGKSRVERQQMVFAALKPELEQGLHALAQRTYTPEEWAKMGKAVNAPSPLCHSKKST